MKRIFISYSHKDKQYLDQLIRHLAVMIDDRLIKVWCDKDIQPGHRIDAEIKKQIRTCDIILLLVSPDYLASKNCIAEMSIAINRRHSSKVDNVIPIILRSCDWKNSPLIELKALPEDGVPISTSKNEDEEYVNIVSELRQLCRHPSSTTSQRARRLPETEFVPPAPQDNKYRVKRDFNEIDRSKFRKKAHRVIKDYFKKECKELNKIKDVDAEFECFGSTHFGCTIVNSNIKYGTAHITVHRRSGSHSLGDIYYSFDENAQSTGAQSIFRVTSDDYNLYLKELWNVLGDSKSPITPEDLAHRLWKRFLEEAGIG